MGEIIDNEHSNNTLDIKNIVEKLNNGEIVTLRSSQGEYLLEKFDNNNIAISRNGNLVEQIEYNEGDNHHSTGYTINPTHDQGILSREDMVSIIKALNGKNTMEEQMKKSSSDVSDAIH